MARQKNCVFAILAGGSGSRFWPLSRPDHPKQFLHLITERSLIQETVHRAADFGTHPIYVVGIQNQIPLLQRHLGTHVRWIVEPLAKNTGPCVCLTTFELLKEYPPDTVVVVMPADHFIENSQIFYEYLNEAIEFAATHDALVTFGIVPTHPHTGYGYIEVEPSKTPGIISKVRRFVEKPNRDKAQSLIQGDRCFWNAGIFVWRLEVIQKSLEMWMAKEWAGISSAKNEKQLHGIYEKITPVPIDIAVIEKSEHVHVVAAAGMGWSDVGSWNSLWEIRESGENHHAVLSGHVASFEAKNCLVDVGPDKSVALVGVQDIVLIENNGVLMVLDRKHDQLVREVCQVFENPGPRKDTSWHSK